MTGARPRIYHCPSCGGPASNSRANVCEFCDGPLVPVGTPDPRHAVRCSSCTALVSVGASYCPTCGDPLAQASPTPVAHRCPACREQTMESFRLQPTVPRPQGHAVHGCRRCGGVWVDRDTLDVMIESAVAQGTGDGQVGRVARRELRMQSKVVYRSCAVCQQTMSRRNFARISGVIVDECHNHGTFFDAGELEDVLAFVRSGGLLLSRKRQQEELEREKRRAQAATMPRSPLMQEVEPYTGLPVDSFAEGPGLDLAFVRWAGRWIRNMFR
ncbi:MAG: zf-TFIIB domain-containing protein [Myxococcota bacterium]